MVRTMRASAVDESLIAELQIGVHTVDEATKRRLDNAARTLPRPARDSRARQAMGYARREIGRATAAAIAAGRDPDRDPASLEAMIGWLHAHAEVLRAEPEGRPYRDFIPAHIREDPFREIDGVIAQLESTLAELAAERGGALARAGASARRELELMSTADYAQLSESERSKIERQLGFDLPADRAAAHDALSRLHAPLVGVTS